MRPVLELYGDGQVHRLREVADLVADQFKLSVDERAMRISSGTLIYVNRVSWAHTYLRKAGLLESVETGVNKITDTGKRVLADSNEDIDNKFLSQFESFRDFRSKTKKDELGSNRADLTIEDFTDLTPQERIQEAISEHESVLKSELLAILRNVNPFLFERIVAELLESMGYGEAKVTQRTNDGGVDAIVNEDALGLSKIYVQAKRYGVSNRVNKKEIRDFIGALELNGVVKGVFITTSTFHQEAESDLARTQKSVVLVDGDKLSSLLLGNNIGVEKEATYNTKRIDFDYFDDGES